MTDDPEPSERKDAKDRGKRGLVRFPGLNTNLAWRKKKDGNKNYNAAPGAELRFVACMPANLDITLKISSRAKINFDPCLPSGESRDRDRISVRTFSLCLPRKKVLKQQIVDRGYSH